ncbi:hypothetical protein C8J57DRAFT_1248055 [Mycena rebaudengoi]|nr:hypothetical protein C8J57DRAFT_1248055 [Mycena rebaudengoi]
MAKQCFFANEGTARLPIDVDAGEQDNPISVEEWIALSKGTLNAHALEDIFNCSICFGIFVKPVICIHVNLKYRTTCPICRAIIKEQPIRDKLFEAALANHTKDKRCGLRMVADSKGYNWKGVVFG